MSSGGGGGSDNTTNQTFVRYAPYVEEQHSAFLNNVSNYVNATIGNNPFSSYSSVDVNSAFFGAGLLITNYPSLFGTFSSYMLNFNTETLWTDIFNNTVNSSVVTNLVAAERDMMDDDIEATVIPRLQIGMRDVNSIISSTFLVGKSLIEDARLKALAKYSTQIRYNLVPVAQARWTTTLEWKKGIVGVYSELMKLYFSTKIDVDETNYSMVAKRVLWPFTILDFQRAALGTLQGAMNTKENVAGASTTSRVISGALSGAAMGAMVGSYWNTAASGAGATATTASYSGSMYGAIGGAVLGAAAAYYY